MRGLLAFFAVFLSFVTVESSIAQSEDSLTYVLQLDTQKYFLFNKEDSISIRVIDGDDGNFATLVIENERLSMNIFMDGVYELKTQRRANRSHKDVDRMEISYLYLEYPFSQLVITSIVYKNSKQVETTNLYIVTLNGYEVKDEHQLDKPDWVAAANIVAEPILNLSIISTKDKTKRLELRRLESLNGVATYSVVVPKREYQDARHLITACAMIMWIYRNNH